MSVFSDSGSFHKGFFTWCNLFGMIVLCYSIEFKTVFHDSVDLKGVPGVASSESHCKILVVLRNSREAKFEVHNVFSF